jgi:hypothetical protein
MVDKRYLKNSEIVKKICKILGYRLSGFDPDWAIFEVRTEVPNDGSVIWKDGMFGNCITIPDEFMATIALLLGYDWQFEHQDTDVDFKESIRNLEILRENIASQSDIERVAEDLGTYKDILDMIRESRKKDLEDCEEKLRSSRFIIGKRKKLREWGKSHS